jgi:hypothetical protein
MTPEAGAPFRGAPAAAVGPVVARYVPYVWYAPLQLGVLAAIFLWAAWSGMLHANAAPWAFVLFLLLAVTKLPVVTVRARVEGGYLVVDGYQWPGAQTRWSCTLHEATDFFLEVTTPGRHTYRRIALRTSDGKVCGLTQNAYVAVAWPHVRLVDRLNAWLRAARGGARVTGT